MLCRTLLFTPFFLLESLFTQAQTLDDLEFGLPNTLEIATWNIEWFPKNGDATIERVQTIIQNLDIDLWAIQEIDDTTAFKDMVNAIDGYEYVLMDGWFGGLVYVYNTDAIEVLDAYEIYTASTFWNPLPRSPLVLHFVFEGESFYTINNHFKCCGNGTINWSDSSDEETRRHEACLLLNEYIQLELPEERVIVLGDLNDLIQEPTANNVFAPFLELPNEYAFADMSIAQGPSSGWSFPGWPSHLDHLLLSNELFDDFDAPSTVVACLDIASHMPGGWSEFDNNVSDHRPVVLQMQITPMDVESLQPSSAQLVRITDALGRACRYVPGHLLLYHFEDGSVHKHMSFSPQSPY
ncbi:MAG: endonuclease/exonuclease/phosphatase family protein [Flavobacteriales bacterium]